MNNVQRFGKVWYWIFDSSRFTWTEKLTFAALCMYQDNNNTCYPSVSELARVTKLGQRTVYRAIDGLEKKGAILRNHRFNGNGKTSNMYQLVIGGSATAAETDTRSCHSGMRVLPERHDGTATAAHKQIHITDLNNRGGDHKLYLSCRAKKLSSESPPLGILKKRQKQ